MSPDGGNDGARLGAGAIASIVGVVALVVFMLQNRTKVSLDFLMFSVSWPLWLVILISALLGAFIWFGVGVMRRHNRRKERRANR